MTMKRLILGGVLLVAGMPAAAQDPNLRPNYGTVSARALGHGPVLLRVRAGGDRDVQRLGPDCRGFVSNAPDIRYLHISGALPVTIRATSAADTTLVVNTPDGRWLCNDDTNGLNPQIVMHDAPSGRYEIWVGTYARGPLQPARVEIGEFTGVYRDPPPSPR